jgi:hypothetical protein
MAVALRTLIKGIAARYARLLSIKDAVPCWRKPSRMGVPH